MLTLGLSLHKFSRSLGCNGWVTSGSWVMLKEPTVFQKDHGAGWVKEIILEGGEQQESRKARQRPPRWWPRVPETEGVRGGEEQKPQRNRRSKTQLRIWLSATKNYFLRKGTQEDRLSQSTKKLAWYLLKMKWWEMPVTTAALAPSRRAEWALQTWGPSGNHWSREHGSGRQKCGSAHKRPGRSPADHQAEGGRDGSPWRGTRDSEGTTEGCSWSWEELRRGKWSTVNAVKRGGRKVQDAPTGLAVLVINTLGKVRCPPLRKKQDNDYLESKQPRISAWSFLLNKKFLLETSRCYNLVRFTVKI